MSTEPTPRTDAAERAGSFRDMRQMERELSGAVRTLSGHQPELCDEIRLERDHLRRELDAAKAAHTDEYWNAMASGGVLEDVKHQLSDAHARESLLKTRLWKSEGYVRVLEARESRLREALVEADKMAGGRWTEWGGRAEMVRDIIRAALAEPPSVPSCIRCGEKLTGVMALTATLCGLCADDELNAAESQTSTGAGNE